MFEIRPNFLRDYTDPTKKTKREPIVLDTESQDEPLVVDPHLKEPHLKKYRMFQMWILGEIPNTEGRECCIAVFKVN